MTTKQSKNQRIEENLDKSKYYISDIIESTLSVEGVSSMSSTLTDAIMAIPGKANHKKGIKITHEGMDFTVDLHVKVFYDTKIPQIAWDIQKSVKKMLLEKYNIKAKAVNIHVDGVNVKEKI